MTNDTEVPKDYLHYRDSHQQYIIATKDDYKDENNNVATTDSASSVVEKLVSNSAFLNSAKDSYSNAEMSYLLNDCIAGRSDLILLDTFSITNQSNSTALVSLPSYDLQLAKNIYIIPIYKPQKTWSCLIIDLTDAIASYLSNTKPEIIYLDPLGEPVPQSIEILLTEKHYIHSHIQHEIKFSQTVRVKEPKDTGIWIIDVLQKFIQNNRLTIPPLINKDIIYHAQLHRLTYVERLIKSIRQELLDQLLF